MPSFGCLWELFGSERVSSIWERALQAVLLPLRLGLRCAMWSACQSSAVLRDGSYGGSALHQHTTSRGMSCSVGTKQTCNKVYALLLPNSSQEPISATYYLKQCLHETPACIDMLQGRLCCILNSNQHIHAFYIILLGNLMICLSLFGKCPLSKEGKSIDTYGVRVGEHDCELLQTIYRELGSLEKLEIWGRNGQDMAPWCTMWHCILHVRWAHLKRWWRAKAWYQRFDVRWARRCCGCNPNWSKRQEKRES